MKFHIPTYINAARVLFFALAAGLCAGCAEDDFEMPGGSEADYGDSQIVLNLAVPESAVKGADRAKAPQGDAETPATTEEAQISDLRMLVFKYSDGALADMRQLTLPQNMNLTNSQAVYRLKGFNPGEYRVYVIANLADATAGVSNESQFKAKLMDYTSRMPEPGKLPMVYEAPYTTKIEETTREAVKVDASMTIAAVKIKYNIIFDKALAGEVFGSNGLHIKNVKVTDAASQAYVVENTSARTLKTREVAVAGSYYNKYEEYQSNKTTRYDIIYLANPSGTTPASYASTWIYSGTLYLPERYAASGAKPTTMQIEAAVTDSKGVDGNVSCLYTINLADYDGAPEGILDMPRGTQYEVIAKVQTLGVAELDAMVVAKNWNEMILASDITSTFLTVNKTTARVESLQDDAITYSTDGTGGVTPVCNTKLNGVDVLQVTKVGSNQLTLRVNPYVDVTKLTDSQLTGTADLVLKAGNISKHIAVEYDIQPFFTITPLSQKIMYDRTSGTVLNTKVFEYRTNLGGIYLTTDGNRNEVRLNNNIRSFTDNIDGGTVTISGVAKPNKSSLLVSCSAPKEATGEIKVEAKVEPLSTFSHYFDAYPLSASADYSRYGSFKQDLTIQVMPPLGDYRIYFRALNDWHTYDGGYGNVSGEWLEGQSSLNDTYYPTEYVGTEQQNNNWIDYWYCANSNNDSAWGNAASNNRYPHQSSHRIYIWTQEGETYTNEDNPMVWRFTDEYIPSENMYEDYANPGWYFYNLEPTRKQKAHMGGASGDRQPEPGTTLMIFNNHTNAKDPGYTVHRATHHLDPGIPLFDYEDREGWVIYDPTCDPYYRIYDDKPIVRDVTYTIYSDVAVTGWYVKYGVAEKNASNSSQNLQQFTIYSNNVSSNTTVNGMKRFQVRMKAVEGDYEKAIRIKFTGVVDDGGNSDAAPAVGHMVYYFYKSSSGKGWANPKAYFYTDNTNTGWGSFISPASSISQDGGTYYVFNVPSGYENGHVIFVNSDGSQQFPASNGGGLPIGYRNKVYYSDSTSGTQSDYWKEWGTQPGNSSTGAVSEDGFVMFNGAAYPNNTGYFNSKTKKWSPTKNF